MMCGRIRTESGSGKSAAFPRGGNSPQGV